MDNHSTGCCQAFLDDLSRYAVCTNFRGGGRWKTNYKDIV